MRKPVGIALDEKNRAIVVCDDGTVWTQYANSWKKYGAAIPGTAEASTK